MKEELAELLYERYPKIFAERHSKDSPMYWGVRCGDGWFDIIDGLCRDLQREADLNGAPQPVAVLVRERFGTLRFDLETLNDAQEALVRKAMDQSDTTCVICGAPGDFSDFLIGLGMLGARCAEHAEDDGDPS